MHRPGWRHKGAALVQRGYTYGMSARRITHHFGWQTLASCLAMLVIPAVYAASDVSPPRKDFDQLFAQEHPTNRVMDEGIEVMSPAPLISFEAQVHGALFRCKTGVIKRVMRDQSALTDVINNTNFCLRLQGKQGKTTTAYVHDQLAPQIRNDTGRGEQPRVFSGYYLYYNHERHQPVLLINRLYR